MLAIDPRTAKTHNRGRITGFNQCSIGVAREWEPHWERHPKGDELLHVLEGVVEVEWIDATGRRFQETLRAGSFMIVPRGVWHRPTQRQPVVMLHVTPGAGTQASFAEEPPGAKRRLAARSARAVRGRRLRA
jgi:quercetin dioxygenase-like cupin family protein